jgi:hypothetical protein
LESGGVGQGRRQSQSDGIFFLPYTPSIILVGPLMMNVSGSSSVRKLPALSLSQKAAEDPLAFALAIFVQPVSMTRSFCALHSS